MRSNIDMVLDSYRYLIFLYFTQGKFGNCEAYISQWKKTLEKYPSDDIQKTNMRNQELKTIMSHYQNIIKNKEKTLPVIMPFNIQLLNWLQNVIPKTHQPIDNTQIDLENKLRSAAAENNIQDLQNIISKINNIDAQDQQKNTALHLAVSEGHDECSMLLVKAGAKMGIANVDGKTSVNYLVENKNTCLIAKILKIRVDEIKSRRILDATLADFEKSNISSSDHNNLPLLTKDNVNHEKRVSDNQKDAFSSLFKGIFSKPKTTPAKDNSSEKILKDALKEFEGKNQESQRAKCNK